MIGFKGFNEKILTFNSLTNIAKGTLVKISGNSTVAAAGNSEDFIGVVSSSEGDTAAVIMSGYVELPYSGDEAPALGLSTIVSDGNGGVKADQDGRQVTVVSIDAASAKIGFIF